MLSFGRACSLAARRALAARSSTNVAAMGRRSLSSGAGDGAAAEKERLIVFDTTLRDGEQSPGATLNLSEKLQIGRVLSMMGVDVCEAGFPIASPGDFDAVSAVAKEIGHMEEGRRYGPMSICGLARATEKDIERCFLAVQHAPRHRIHTFLATSDIHLEHKLKISRDECIANSVKAVQFAASLCEDVEFSPEDAGRSDPAFLALLLSEVVKAGAKTLNIPDTVGYVTPEEYGDLIAYLVDNVEGVEEHGVVFSTHCHNDLGLATANTLAGVRGGARQVEVTVNGIGERAGNTAIEELVMAIQTRPQCFDVTCDGMNPVHITRASRMVSALTGLLVQPNKAIVGANAFAHEAGIHQDGVLKHPETYEIMTAETVGLVGANNLVLGKHSGKHAYMKRMEDLGYTDFTEDELTALTNKFKVLADEKKVVTDADIEAIVNDEMYQADDVWDLQSVHVTGGDMIKPTATVTLVNVESGEEWTHASVGSGPIDAIFSAIFRIIGVPVKLLDYKVGAITGGTEALGEVTVRIQPPGAGDDDDAADDGSGSQAVDDPALAFVNPQTGLVGNRSYSGMGADNDILVASARAYVHAINRLIVGSQQQHARLERKKSVKERESRLVE